MDYQDGDEAGLKSADILIEGENAYGFLKGESGVHRRCAFRRSTPPAAAIPRSPRSRSYRIFTDDSADFEIKPEDYEMQVFRPSGAGGQHINKTSSAVRLIHKATGIVVSCKPNAASSEQGQLPAHAAFQAGRDQEREHLEKDFGHQRDQKKIEWGSQIRSYVFMPYTLAKDTRTGFENANIGAVMDGEIDGFINAYLSALATGNWAGK